MQALLALLLQAGKNIVAALITRRMVLWALERYAKSTENHLDDYAVQLIEAGLAGDEAAIQAAVQGLADTWLKDKTHA
ncbi:hypothetical protein PVT67_11740 [Gallaecimonas kandeliae]|uniref:hypothetical protein n=1 Tax=Gallaecimonas kandeliae TaxID=3029055 RepID=UPI00264A4C32|nr:hypothetical protein [Gallaecimonas kandeliae]WKE64352.1 hypothetical protein PVT67_11740 [Gallaecimonas kandeliae]